MSVGAFDACTHLENIVLFASTASNQQVPAGCYQNLSTLGGTKQMINGDVELNGNLDLSTNLVKASTALSQTRLLLTGDREQHLGGNGLGAVDNIVVEKTGGEIILDESIAILDALFMTRGVIKADPGVLLLGGSAVIQETDQSYVLGQVATQRKLNAGSGNNFGGLGIRIRTGAESLLGQTVVIRTTGEAREPGQINRSFEIIPTNTQGIDVNIEFYYDLFDLTGANEEELVLEHSVNGAPYVPLETIMHIDTNMIEVRNLTELGIITARPGDMAVSAYPSPMYGDELTIEYVMEQGGRVNINVFDLSGHSVAREITEGFPGHNIHRLTEMGNLAPGIYFVRIKAKDEKRVGTQKFIRIVPR
jgi:hypothetical protein